MTVRKLGQTLRTTTCWYGNCKSTLVYKEVDVQSVFVNVIRGTAYWIECCECRHEVTVNPWSER